jgi:FkbM family methyltransferase
MRYFGERVYFPRDCHLVARVLHAGVYEPELIDELISALRGGGVHFDVGANIGLMAIPLLNAVPDVYIHSFEPSPRTFQYLQRTHRETKFRARWAIADVALSSSSGVTSFCMHNESDGAFDGILDTRRAKNGEIVEVSMITLDTYWIEAGRPAVNTIKIDVEGFEDEVLKGGKLLLSTCRPLVFLEWSAANLRPGLQVAEILNVATKLGYRIYSLPWRQSLFDATDLVTAMRFSESFMLAPIEPPNSSIRTDS